MIRTEDLAKSFQGREVLCGVGLQVRAGEIFGFVGPNGSGKSTFLKCLVGVVRPDRGRIGIAGVDALREPLAARREIGYAPGETALYHRMRCDELLEFAIGFHPRPDLARGLALLDRFEVPPRRKVGQLSHGMKRKLLLAQALASGASVLLLDEPMEGLDPDARRQVEALLRDEAAAGRTIFFSSHDLASVERVCHRVAFLRSGRVLAVGTLAELTRGLGQVLALRLREPRRADQLPSGPGFEWRGAGDAWRLRFECAPEAALARLAALPLAGIRDAHGGLEEVFETLYGPEPPARPADHA